MVTFTLVNGKLQCFQSCLTPLILNRSQQMAAYPEPGSAGGFFLLKGESQSQRSTVHIKKNVCCMFRYRNNFYVNKVRRSWLDLCCHQNLESLLYVYVSVHHSGKTHKLCFCFHIFVIFVEVQNSQMRWERLELHVLSAVFWMFRCTKC